MGETLENFGKFWKKQRKMWNNLEKIRRNFVQLFVVRCWLFVVHFGKLSVNSFRGSLLVARGTWLARRPKTQDHRHKTHGFFFVARRLWPTASAFFYLIDSSALVGMTRLRVSAFA